MREVADVMKRCIQKAACTIAVIAITLSCLCACHSNHSGTLTICSTDYNITELQEQELNREQYSHGTGTDILPYQCYVTASHTYGSMPRRLVVNNSRPPRVHTCFGSNGYFVGMDYTEFAAGLVYRSYTGLDGSADTVDILPGRCVALIEGDGTYCLAVTSWNCFEENENTALYRLGFPSEEGDDQPTVKKICDITPDYAYVAEQAEDGTVYVGTDNGLFAVTVDGTVTKLKVPEAWPDLGINSMVEMDDTLYIGTMYGVLEYNRGDGVFRWFPMPYEKVVETGYLSNSG